MDSINNHKDINAEDFDDLLKMIATFEKILYWHGPHKAIEYASSLPLLSRLILRRYDEIQKEEEQKLLALDEFASNLNNNQ